MSFKCLADGCRSKFDKGKKLYEHCRNVNHPFRFPCIPCHRCFANQSGRRSHLRKSKIHRNDTNVTQSHPDTASNTGSPVISNTPITSSSFSIVDADEVTSTTSYDVVSDISSSIDMSIISLSTSQQDSDILPSTISYVSDAETSGQELCAKCNLYFNTLQELLQHYIDSVKHNWCFACSKDFVSAKKLRKHYRSDAHLPKNIKCPLCSRKFKYPSAVADHIESGKHKLTRKQITFAVHSMGVIPTISIDGRIQQGENLSIFTLPKIPKLTANSNAFNGQTYKCHIRKCERTFHGIASLERHLNSAAHDEPEFKCPNPECKRVFKVVSALMRHIESEKCELANLKEVVSRFESMTAQFTKLISNK